MTESLLIDEKGQKTKTRFSNIGDFEIHIKPIDVDYANESVIFTEWLYKIN